MPVLWLGNAVSAKVRAEAVSRVNEAALLVENAVKVSMKKGGTTESGEIAFGAYSLKTRKGLKRSAYDPVTGKKGQAKIGAYRSAPGEVPRVQTGALRRSITIQRATRMVPIAKVGSNLKYAKALELGTKNMKPRPYLRVALLKMLGSIKAIFARPMGPSI